MSYPQTQTLFRIINGLRYFGVGCKLTRCTYQNPDTYWIITRVLLSKDQNHGKAWGRLVWNGRAKPRVQKIGPANKKQWTMVSFPDYHSFKGVVDDFPDSLKNKDESIHKNAQIES